MTILREFFKCPGPWIVKSLLEDICAAVGKNLLVEGPPSSFVTPNPHPVHPYKLLPLFPGLLHLLGS